MAAHPDGSSPQDPQAPALEAPGGLPFSPDLLDLARRMAQHYARRNVNNGLSFDDLFGPAQLGLLRALRTFRPGHNMAPRSFAWLCIRTEILTFITRELRHHCPAEPAEYYTDGAPTEDILVSQLNAAQSIRRVLCHLPTRQRQVLELRYLEGKSAAETAALLGCTSQWVELVRLAALARCKRYLSPPPSAEPAPDPEFDAIALQLPIQHQDTLYLERAGASRTAIARIFGWTLPTTTNRCREAWTGFECIKRGEPWKPTKPKPRRSKSNVSTTHPTTQPECSL